MDVTKEMCVQRVPEGRRGHITRRGQQEIISARTDVAVAVIEPSRSKSVSRTRGKRRLAVAIRDPEIDAPPLVRMRSRDGENAVEKGEWTDPEDLRANQRTGRVIRGYWSSCALRKIQRTSREITDMHVRTAEWIRICFDAARVGFQAERDGMPVNQVVYLPKMDFSAGAHAQARALGEFRRIWRVLQEHQRRMLSVIVLRNHSVQFWCDAEQQRIGYRPNDKIELGKLVGMMDFLANYLDADVDDAVQNGRMRA